MQRAAVSVLVLGLVTMAWSHAPRGEVFYAVQFPDQAAPVIDGNLDDWALVPEKYSRRSDTLFSAYQNLGYLERGEYDPGDIEIWHRIGFNPKTDELYFASEVFDDYHNTDREDLASLWLDDLWDVRVDATAMYDPPAAPQPMEADPRALRALYLFAVPPLGGVYHYVRHGEENAWMLDGGGHRGDVHAQPMLGSTRYVRTAR